MYHTKTIKELMKDLKTVYKAPTEELALTNLDIFEDKWIKKYPMCVSSWRNNWAELSTYFKYPEGIRKLIYTTNAMENFNRQQQKAKLYFKMIMLCKKILTQLWQILLASGSIEYVVEVKYYLNYLYF